MTTCNHYQAPPVLGVQQGSHEAQQRTYLAAGPAFYAQSVCGYCYQISNNWQPVGIPVGSSWSESVWCGPLSITYICHADMC